MKNTTILRIIAMTVALMCLVATFTSCGQSEVTYKVNVKDALGNPYTSGIVVKFMQDDEQVAMQAVDKNGVASKTLSKGDYSVELSFTADADNYYYNGKANLTAKENEIDVILANKITSEPQVLYVSSDEFDAYAINVGCTFVELNKGSMNYFLFTPTESGYYEFSVVEGKDCEIGYYGAPHFVQSMSAAEVKDNKFNINVTPSMIGTNDGGTTVLVIGVNAGDDNCVLAIDRVSDYKKTIEDEPWHIYEATHEMSPYTLPEDYEIKEFDLTASTDSYKIVLNEDDGFYHLNSKDGPLVLVRLAEDCDYIACFKTILDRSGVSRYFYDDKGEFDKKVSYSECLLEYIEYVDEVEGVYPLTEDLKHIIIQRGEYVGWWDIESSGYIFKDANGNNDSTINADIAWLLMCCYLG
ncbi:MAG: hypothetical protein IJF69_03410 [Clostridia bacterium]|nr:hypothetical protein [Clostridia bacterium]